MFACYSGFAFLRKRRKYPLTKTNMKFLKRKFAWSVLLAISLQVIGMPVKAASFGDVVINEVSWTGTSDGSNDEWIELYNSGSAPVDLSGWMIVDDGAAEYKISSGSIAAHGYFLIEDTEETVSNKAADAVIGLSLANAGDSLILKDSDGQTIDEVNKSGGAWPAGNSVNKASMERVSPDENGDDAENWKSAISGNGAKGRNSSDILGTPGGVNSNYGGEGVDVFMSEKEVITTTGAFVEVEILVENASDLYAYGLDITYPEKILSFVSASEGELLKAGNTATSFYSGLKDDNEGILIIGAARMINPPNGVDGSGVLAKLKFKVIATESDSGEVKILSSSFLADSQGDVIGKFSGMDVAVAEYEDVNLSIANLKVEEGEKRYSLQLSWQEDLDGASSYFVKRKNPNGEFVTLGEVSNPVFVDEDSIANGGKIVPGVNYTYQIVAVKNGIQSEPFEVEGSESRGIKGDNDRSDIVNGKDLERLARSYGSELGDEEYDAVKDTSFDGAIDGNDLIDIGMNFGLSYQP